MMLRYVEGEAQVGRISRGQIFCQPGDPGTSESEAVFRCLISTTAAHTDIGISQRVQITSETWR